MGMMTVRNIPDEVHDALRARARKHDRSTEAEVRSILADAVRPRDRLRMGDALAALGREIGLTEEDVDMIEQARDTSPAEPVHLE